MLTAARHLGGWSALRSDRCVLTADPTANLDFFLGGGGVEASLMSAASKGDSELRRRLLYIGDIRNC